jgi:ubiquitin C-terminal hydrolase
MAFKHDYSSFVNVHNKTQINNTVKSCYVALTDIKSDIRTHGSKLSGYEKLLSVWQQQYSQCEYNVQDDDNDNDDDTSSENSLGSVIVNENHGYKLIGLDNPRNFCYLNSIIQIFICILLHSGCTYQHTVTDKRLFANALLNYRFKEGFKLQYRKRNLQIIRSWYTKGKIAIPLLNGIRQQDAHEAFMRINDILHDGTKKCLIPDLPDNLIEDSMITSFPRFLFRFTIEKTFTCVICNNQCNTEEFMDEITVTSSKYNKTNEMINEYWTSTITKQCIQCKIDTSHSEQIKIINHPRVFTVIILRFDNNMEKIGTPINIKKSILLFGKKLSLLGMINHHGRSVANGHYTATMHYNSWWHADDNKVTPFSIDLLNNNSTAYILFYRQ